jgi:hypothetical protein
MYNTALFSPTFDERNTMKKIILISAMLAGSMQNAWGMQRQQPYQSQQPQSLSDPYAPSAPLMSPTNSMRNAPPEDRVLSELNKIMEGWETKLIAQFDQINKRIDNIEERVECNHRAIAVLYAKSCGATHASLHNVGSTFDIYERATRGCMPGYLADKVDDLNHRSDIARTNYDLSTMLALEKEMNQLTAEVLASKK